MMRFINLIKAVIVASLMSMVLCSGSFASLSGKSAGEYTLTVVNNSSVDINRMYVAWNRTGRWGPDLLGRNVLRPRTPFRIALPPGDYELMMIDSQNRRCLKQDIQLYADQTWPFDDNWLSNCPH